MNRGTHSNEVLWEHKFSSSHFQDCSTDPQFQIHLYSMIVTVFKIICYLSLWFGYNKKNSFNIETVTFILEIISNPLFPNSSLIIEPKENKTWHRVETVTPPSRTYLLHMDKDDRKSYP